MVLIHFAILYDLKLVLKNALDISFNRFILASAIVGISVKNNMTTNSVTTHVYFTRSLQHWLVVPLCQSIFGDDMPLVKEPH